MKTFPPVGQTIGPKPPRCILHRDVTFAPGTRYEFTIRTGSGRRVVAVAQRPLRDPGALRRTCRHDRHGRRLPGRVGRSRTDVGGGVTMNYLEKMFRAEVPEPASGSGAALVLANRADAVDDFVNVPTARPRRAFGETGTTAGYRAGMTADLSAGALAGSRP